MYLFGKTPFLHSSNISSLLHTGGVVNLNTGSFRISTTSSKPLPEVEVLHLGADVKIVKSDNGSDLYRHDLYFTLLHPNTEDGFVSVKVHGREMKVSWKNEFRGVRFNIFDHKNREANLNRWCIYEKITYKELKTYLNGLKKTKYDNTIRYSSFDLELRKLHANNSVRRHAPKIYKEPLDQSYGSNWRDLVDWHQDIIDSTFYPRIFATLYNCYDEYRDFKRKKKIFIDHNRSERVFWYGSNRSFPYKMWMVCKYLSPFISGIPSEEQCWKEEKIRNWVKGKPLPF